MKGLGISLFFSILVCSLSAQTTYPQDYFRSPLDIPLNLSGNFGELRTNHFHTGIDIKTEQREGLKIYAAAEGYVSRIKVSPVGYGYALYITHPNGYTTLYGHLKSYAPKIDEYVKRNQYLLKSFSVDLFPNPEELPVTKGEVVALSGNTGGSGGPHLHFEVRETASEKLINPMLFGFQIADKIAPTVMGIWIVPMNDTSTVNGGKVPLSFGTKTYSGACVLKTTNVPTVYGDFGFAIHTSDMLNGNANKCGIYRIELFVDGIQVYGQRMDRLDFATNRAMNAHTIYERFKKDRSQIHGSYRLPGNPLDIYDNLVNDGIVTFKDGKKHAVEYRVVDLMGNKSSVKFDVQALPNAQAKPSPPQNFIAKWNWEEDNYFENQRLKIQMPAFTLYEDLDLIITETKTIEKSLTPTYKIASAYEPIHNKFTLSINASVVPEKYRNKAVVVRWDPDKARISSEGGVMKDGWITAEPTYLGFFGVLVDTINPSITSIDFAPNMKGRGLFTMKISDGLSGIDQIIPQIDGEWALMEYDAKTARLMYYFDKRYIKPGKHFFELTVIDGVGNKKYFNGNFEW
jgi:murein DD-endopeptidase MepM/ murein hydrolase activator NlpD